MHKPYISQHAKYQYRYEQNVGFCVELYSFLFPFYLRIVQGKHEYTFIAVRLHFLSVQNSLDGQQ